MILSIIQMFTRIGAISGKDKSENWQSWKLRCGLTPRIVPEIKYKMRDIQDQ